MIIGAALSRSAPTTEPILKKKLQQFETARRDHLGYPYNLDFPPDPTPQFNRFLINNLGDPFSGSHYATECCDLERDVVDWFMSLWDCDNHETYWGSVGASGTEGNLWALYLAREAHPNGLILYSEDAHYSIPKAAKILRTESVMVSSNPNGSISLDALARIASTHKKRHLIVALTSGTTVKGAHDDLGQAISVLNATGHTPERRFIHVDGALNAMVLPFVREAAQSIKPSFNLAIDSISTSGHKMVGTPMPCGVLVARREHIDRVSTAISYIRTNDTTLMGSRNGHAVLALWDRLRQHGRNAFEYDVYQCLTRAKYLASRLSDENVPTLLNDHSLTVVFPQPGQAIVSQFQLACQNGLAHAIMMPNVKDELVERFLCNYLDWWRSSQNTGHFSTSSRSSEIAL